MPWQVAFGAGLFSSHAFLRFCFDWGHDTRLRPAHGAVLAMLWLGWALLGAVPLVRGQLLGVAQILATGLPLYAALCTPAPSGAWAPFAVLVSWMLLVPVAIAFGVLVRLGLSSWLRRRARLSTRQARVFDYGCLFSCFPASAALQFAAGSLPGLFVGRFWENPSQPREGFAETLWMAEVVAWGISLSGLSVCFVSWWRARGRIVSHQTRGVDHE